MLAPKDGYPEGTDPEPGSKGVSAALQPSPGARLAGSKAASSHALPSPHGVQLDALKRDDSWAKSQAPSQAPGLDFPEVHNSSGQGLGLGQSGSLALPGLHNILIIQWECLILARFVHQLFSASNAEGFAGSCTWGGGS